MTVTLADLRSLDLFDDVDDDGLREFLAVTHERAAEPGEAIAQHGEPSPGVVLLLEGTAQTFLVREDRLEPVGRQTPPTWALAISVLTGGPLAVRLQA
jgi:hypothetical protein